MNKSFTALAAAGLMVAALSTPADARCRGCGVGAGIIGGLAVGAIIGSALSGPRYYDAPPPAAYYGEPGPAYIVDEPLCRLERRRYWDGYGYRTRRVEVCE